MLDAFNLDGRDSGAFDRRKQRTTKRITYRRSKASFEWLRRKAAISLGEGLCVCRKAARHLKSCPKIILIHSHSVQVPKKNAADQAVTIGATLAAVTAPVGLITYYK